MLSAFHESSHSFQEKFLCTDTSWQNKQTNKHGSTTQYSNNLPSWRINRELCQEFHRFLLTGAMESRQGYEQNVQCGLVSLPLYVVCAKITPNPQRGKVTHVCHK